MPINDFANDGAVGAGGNAMNSGPVTEGGGFQPAIPTGASSGGFGASHMGSGANLGGGMFSPANFATMQRLRAGDTSGSFRRPANATHFFEEGGSVDDGGSSDIGSLLSLALSSVDAGLDYGRQKYGLSKGGQQQASMGRTPMIPGNQSESGIPRPQPMPGPLPPTTNPFGKRGISQNDNDADDQGTQSAQAGAIPDNDADDQETA